MITAILSRSNCTTTEDKKKNDAILKYLVKLNPECVEHCSSFSMGVFHLLVKYDDVECIKMLVKLMKCTNPLFQRDESGSMPVHHAVVHQSENCLHYLLTLNWASGGYRNHAGNTAITL